MLSLTVEIERPGRAAETRTLEIGRGRPLKIGSLPTADLSLEDPGVARLHAVLTPCDTHSDLVDLGARGGTFVNGARIQRARLSQGDEIRVGGTRLRVWHGARPQPLSLPTVPEAVVASCFPDVGTPLFESAVCEPVAKVNSQQATAALSSGRPHPSLPPEPPVTEQDRTLELRVYWGEVLLDVCHYPRATAVHIGEARGADIFLTSENLPVERFPLLRPNGRGWTLTFSDQMEGEAEIDGRTSPLAEVARTAIARPDPGLAGCTSIELATRTRALLHWGGVSFAIRFVPPATPVPRGRAKSLDFPFLNTLLVSSCAHVALVTVLLLYPYDLQAIQEQHGIDGVIELIAPRASAAPAAKPPRPQPKPSGLRPAPEPQPPARDVSPEEARRPLKHAGGGLSREAVDAKLRQRMGVLFGRGNQGSGILQGHAPMSLADGLQNVISSLWKGEVTSVVGDGLRGDGPILGGLRGGGRDIGPIGLAADRGGCRKGNCSGPGLGRHVDHTPPVTFKPPTFGEALPRDVIRKVIDENKGQIRYCYERELQRHVGLAGLVRVRFVIGATGRVALARVTETTLDNEGVESCICAKIAGWVFPAPAGGGHVEVNYPFILRSTGE